MTPCRCAHSAALSSVHTATCSAHPSGTHPPSIRSQPLWVLLPDWLAAGPAGVDATVTSYSPSVSGCCLCGLPGLLAPGRLLPAAPSSAAAVALLLAAGMDAEARLLPPRCRCGNAGCAGDVTPKATCDAAAYIHRRRFETRHEQEQLQLQHILLLPVAPPSRQEHGLGVPTAWPAQCKQVRQLLCCLTETACC